MIDERADSDWANLKAVAPFTGAWIEIVSLELAASVRKTVAPFTGAWIEMSVTNVERRAVIESHPSRVRGLK